MGFTVSSSPAHAAFATLQGTDSLDVGSIFCGCWDMSPRAGTRRPTSCWQLGGQPSPPLPASRSGPHPWLLAPWSSGPPSHKAPGDGVGQSRATSRLSALLRLVLHPTGSGLGCGHLGGGLLMRAGSEPAGRHSCGTRRCSNQREGDTHRLPRASSAASAPEASSLQTWMTTQPDAQAGGLTSVPRHQQGAEGTPAARGCWERNDV